MLLPVVNTWGVVQPLSSSQPRPFPGFDVYFNPKKSVSVSFVLGWGSPVQSRPSIFSRRNRKNSDFCCRCTATANNSDNDNSNDNDNGPSSLDWDWNRWNRHFSEIEQAENFASVLKFQLEEAIEKEDFHEAAKVKKALSEATSMDSVAEIMSLLKSAIDEERYHEAAKLSRRTGSGLVGWWVGYSKDSDDDPFGRIIRISPSMGRFVGKSYTPRQLITGSPGDPIFEIYVIKNADDSYHMQVVYLQRGKGNSMSNSPSVPVKSPSKPEVENVSSVEVQEHEEKVERSEEKSSIEGATEEGIKSVINFLKEKIPGLKVKVMDINVEEKGTEDNDPVKQLMEEESDKTNINENFEEEVNNLDEPDEFTFQGDSDASGDEKDLDMKLFIGGVVHNNEEAPAKDEFTRYPAEIKDSERDSFVFHIPRRNLDYAIRENKVAKLKVALLAAEEGVSELMPPAVAKAFSSLDKIYPQDQVSKNVREMVKGAISLLKKRNGFPEYTSFSRIVTSQGDLDPFDGLYVGAFGPYGTEVVQLRRKFGHWSDLGEENNSSDMEFFEYVEAVKLTGDLNVPAGQVTFRAKIGGGNRISTRGMYPDELGVMASYKGQGRIAESGFQNPKWVEGELLQLNGKGIGPYVKGADLGFLYVVPEQSFLVIFNRLKLPE